MNALAPMSRLMGAGDLMVEYDQPIRALRGAPASCSPTTPTDAPGADRSDVLRTPRPNASLVSTLERRTCRSGQRRLALPHRHLTVGPTRGPMVRGESDTAPSVMEGDATGLDKPGALGLLNTDSAVYYAGTLANQPARLHDLASQGAQLRADRHQPEGGLPPGTPSRRIPATPSRPATNPAKTDLSDSPVELVPRHDHHSKSYATLPLGAVSVTAQQLRQLGLLTTPEDQALQPIDNISTRPGSRAPSCRIPRGSGGSPSSPTRSPGPHHPVRPQRGDRSRWVSEGHLTFDGKDPVTEALNAIVAP